MLSKKIITGASLMLASTALLGGCSSNSKSENKSSTAQSSVLKKLPADERNTKSLVDTLNNHPATLKLAQGKNVSSYYILEDADHIVGDDTSIKELNNKQAKYVAEMKRKKIILKDIYYIKPYDAPKSATFSSVYVKKYKLNSSQQYTFYKLLTDDTDNELNLHSAGSTKAPLLEESSYFKNMESMYVTISKAKVVDKNQVQATNVIHYKLQNGKKGTVSVKTVPINIGD